LGEKRPESYEKRLVGKAREKELTQQQKLALDFLEKPPRLEKGF